MNSKQRSIGLWVAVLLIGVFYIIPCPESLGQLGWYAAGILLIAITLWITDALPKFVITLILILLLTWSDIFIKMSDAFSHFLASPLILVLGAYFLTAMLKNTNIPLRLMGMFLRIGKDSGRIFLASVMSATALISSVISDYAAVSIFYAFVVAVFNIQRRIRPDKNPKLVKALMLGIPFAGLAGGLMTPVGSPGNALVIGMLAQYADIEISFLKWCCLLIPVVLVIMVVMWFFLCVVFKPEKIDPKIFTEAVHQINTLGLWKNKEKKAIILLFAMLAMWIAGSWIKILDSATVVIIGATIMFLPGVSLIEPEDFRRNASWDNFFMIGGIMILCAGLQNAGLIDWIINVSFSAIMGLPMLFTLLLASVIILVVRTLIPAGPAILLLAVPTMVMLSLSYGMNPANMLIIGIVWGTMDFFLPIDVIMALTYDSGQFSVKDMIRVGTPIALTLLALVTLMTPLITSLFAGVR